MNSSLIFRIVLVGLVFEAVMGCYIETPEDEELYELMCKKPGDSEPCSGRGVCFCGMCHCSDGTKGRYCECTNDCPLTMDGMCGGPRRGHCGCGECVCNHGYTGDACLCETSTDNCMGWNGKVCSGHGNCVCGQCQCDRDSYYRGRLCDECPTCLGPCERMRSCVKAFYSGQKKLSDFCQDSHVVIVDELPAGEDETAMCQYSDDFGNGSCLYTFAYSREDRRFLYMKRTLENC